MAVIDFYGDTAIIVIGNVIANVVADVIVVTADVIACVIDIQRSLPKKKTLREQRMYSVYLLLFKFIK